LFFHFLFYFLEVGGAFGLEAILGDVPCLATIEAGDALRFQLVL
jgi:hypothetical protein